MAIIISTGKWGGIYWYHGFGLRLCLGWVAITFLPVDGDVILEQAAEQTVAPDTARCVCAECGQPHDPKLVNGSEGQDCRAGEL